MLLLQLIVTIRKTIEVTAIPEPMQQCRITRFGSEGIVQQEDTLAVEEPLEIRVRWQRAGAWEEEPLTITMRTPGHDLELAAGLLFSEGIVRQRSQIFSIRHADNNNTVNNNTVVVELVDDHQLDMKRFQRNFISTSSCGVCGKMAIESLALLHQPQLDEQVPCIDVALLKTLPSLLKAAQTLFAQTGGVHAAGLFSTDGHLLMLREDVGRHNAMDKLLGACLSSDQFSMRHSILLVSGRAGFEIIQKALAADIGFVVAVGAPTSLAVELAQTYGMTLIGFLKDAGFNCYSGPQRLK
jgi:FdhD protein